MPDDLVGKLLHSGLYCFLQLPLDLEVTLKFRDELGGATRSSWTEASCSQVPCPFLRPLQGRRILKHLLFQCPLSLLHLGDLGQCFLLSGAQTHHLLVKRGKLRQSVLGVRVPIFCLHVSTNLLREQLPQVPLATQEERFPFAPLHGSLECKPKAMNARSTKRNKRNKNHNVPLH